MTDLENAKSTLSSGGYTCVHCLGDKIYTSQEGGVKPLVVFLESEERFEGYSAADKVVGRATAFLYVLLGVKNVYADVISRPALDVLESNGISASFGTAVDNIINRKGDGICPFEAAVLDLTSPDAAYKAVREKMAEMKIVI